ncbi:concanavalin A-like lectin/glucanase domain-containing protein [Aspergillus aurantiobrunneus]
MFSLAHIFFLLAGVAAAQSSGGDATTGISAASYTHRIFHDFRSLDDSGGLYSSEPARIANDEDSSAAPIQPGYLTSDGFVRDFAIQTWGSPAGEDSPLRKQYSNRNVYIARDEDTFTTKLVLRAYRNEHFVSSGEIDTKLSNIFHASIRVRARVRGDPGACAGLFTYFDDDNESDIEILTRDATDHIRYTNQPGLDENGNEIPEASSNVVMANGAVWTDWNDHRLDWTPELSAWYLNGELAVTKTYGIPRNPSSFIMNMWGDGGSWSGAMSIGSAAYFEIQWIDILFNVSDSS